MTSKLPRTAAFLAQDHVAHDALWVAFAERLEGENAELRAALETQKLTIRRFQRLADMMIKQS